ncbi:MAG TPA: POTRA domain-containing protein [Candidatus Angelobacter sp.]|jgi:outer membrane protein insertion porin family|nr:POTRA domain-containing protein [Candidatus Angelobacter sp.]
MKYNFFLCFLFFILPTIGYGYKYKKESTYILSGVKIKGLYRNYVKKKIINIIYPKIGKEIKGKKNNDFIKDLWKTNLLKNIFVFVEKIKGKKIFFQIILEEVDKLSDLNLKGTGLSSQKFNVKIGSKINGDFLSYLKKDIRKYYIKKGFPYVYVIVNTENRKKEAFLKIHVQKGPGIRIKKIFLEGNKKVSSEELLRSRIKKVKLLDILNKKKSTYVTEVEKDIIDKYQSLGFIDAHIVSKSLLRLDEKNFLLKIKLYEGKRYIIGDVSFIGNTILEKKKLLNFEKGDTYNPIGIIESTEDPKNESSIYSLYLNKGYYFSKVFPVEKSVKDHKVYVEVRIEEGRLTFFDRITFSGNFVTKDHVIIRELKTIPGDVFSERNIKQTFLHLIRLGIFDHNILPFFMENKNKNTVDLEWKLKEKVSGKFKIQGGYVGNQLIGNLNIYLNNLSLENLLKKRFYHLLPQGNGQWLSLSAQVSKNFQYYGFSFTDPWLGKYFPTSFTFEGNYSQNSKIVKYDFNHLNKKDYFQPEKNKNIGFSSGISRRLKWPDDYFSWAAFVNYNNYHYSYGEEWSFKDLSKVKGIHDLRYSFSLNRTSSGPDPIFKVSGSEFDLTTVFTIPYSLLHRKKNKYPQKWVEYFKIKLKTYWYKSFLQKFVLKTGGEVGFLMNYNKYKEIPSFQRFFIGGYESTNLKSGKDYISLRGYPNPGIFGGISPKIGGLFYNRILLEVRYPIIMNESGIIWLLGFLEGGNVYSHYNFYKTFQLKKSIGLGFRTFFPIFGTLGVDFGYGLDQKTENVHKWQIHLILG